MPPVQNLTSDEPFAGPDDGRLQPTEFAEDPAAEYGRALLRHLARFPNYPAAARDAKLEGTVQIVFVMRRDGSVVSAWIGTSSGAEILDQEAMAILRRAEPLPSVPDQSASPAQYQMAGRFQTCRIPAKRFSRPPPPPPPPPPKN